MLHANWGLLNNNDHFSLDTGTRSRPNPDGVHTAPAWMYYIRDLSYNLFRDKRGGFKIPNRHQIEGIRSNLVNHRTATEGSRGVGKTFINGCTCTISLWHDPYGLEILGIAPYRVQVRKVFNEVAIYFQHSEWLTPLHAKINRGEVEPGVKLYPDGKRGAEGSTYRLGVVSKTHKGVSVHGEHPDIVIVDESGFISDSNYHNVIVPTTKGQLIGPDDTVVPSKLWEIGTPFAGVEHFKDAVTNAPGYEDYVIRRYPFYTGLNYDDAKLIPDNYVQQIGIRLEDTIGYPGTFDEPYKDRATRYNWARDILPEFLKLGPDHPDWVTQYMADWSVSTGAFYSRLLLLGDGSDSPGAERSDMSPLDKGAPGEVYGAGLDFGVQRNSSVLLIGPIAPYMAIRYALEIRPTTKRKMGIPQQMELFADVVRRFNVRYLVYDATGVQKNGANEYILKNELEKVGASTKLIPYEFSMKRKCQDHWELRTMMSKGEIGYPQPEKYRDLVRYRDIQRINDFGVMRKQLLAMIEEATSTADQISMNQLKKIHKPEGGADDYVDALLMFSTLRKRKRRMFVARARM